MSIHSQNIERKPNSDSIKGFNSVANLRKIMLYNPSYDLVNDNMYKTIWLNLYPLILKVLSKIHSDVNQGPQLCCKFGKNDSFIIKM